MSSEPKLETHEDAVNLVKTVFEQMGRTVIEKAPRRPHSTSPNMLMTPQHDAFLMDFEMQSLRTGARERPWATDAMRTRNGQN